ncbi:MAG: glycoside hydrolase family 26 protein, partial [Acidimicrobiia bacterium]
MHRQVASLLTLALLTSVVYFVPPVSAQAVTIDGTGQVHGGIYSSEFFASSDLDALASATGKRVTFGGTFNSVNENDGVAPGWSNTREMLEEVWKGQATPFANLTIPATAASIASGSWDAKINEWAGHLEQYLDKGEGRSLVLAPLQEMNGDWTPYGCDPANFKLAYKRIVDILKGRGIDETQVRFAFAPNGWTSPGCGDLTDYYPGDAYVDVIGVSAYRWNGTDTVYQVMGGTVADLSTWFPTKPIVIAQTAAWPSTSKDQWIQDMFAWAASNPHVVAVIYFNFDNSSLSGETDWRIWIPPVVNGGWKNGMNSGSTAYQWPLTDWFRPGTLSIAGGETNLCPDGKDCDTVAFQDGGGKFHIWTHASSGTAGSSFFYGNPGDIPFSGDWDCDGVETFGLYRQSDGYVYLRNSNTQGVADISFFFGNPGDFPVAGDFNGDGCDTVSIYRPSEGKFYIINKLGSNDGGLGAAEYSFFFGNPGDKPFVGDFDSDGIDTIGLHRESTGLVYFRNTNSTGVADFEFI